MTDNRERPLAFAALAPLAAESRVVGAIERMLAVLARAVSESRITAFRTRISRLQRDEPAAAVGGIAWLIAVASFTHIAMLLFVERYHFPSRAALVVPALVAVVALAAIPLRGQIAQAITDRRHQ